MNDNRKLTVGSLFSGIGGIELGLERTGFFETRWFVENNLYAQAILRKHWKGIPIYSDITAIDWSTCERVDVLTGGFPCQDISIAGKKKGIKEGTRSGLWFEFFKAIRILRPRYVVIENVSEITNNGLSTVLANLAQIGYDAEWYDLRASDFGAWHKRERIFIIAYPNRNGLNFNREDGGEIYQDKERNIQTMASEGLQSSSQSFEDGKLENVSNSECKYVSRHGEGRKIDCTERQAYDNNGKDSSRDESFRMEQGWWATEPNVGRVAHGIPFRVDRIRCLGNAVVPQVAEFIGEIIKEKEGVA